MGVIYFCGDPHSHFDHILTAVRTQSPDAVILLGDIIPERPLHIELASIRNLTDIWWIPGNHDTGEVKHYDNLFGSELADRNLHGRVETIAGLRITGLGGVFRTKVWDGLQDSTESPQSLMKTMGQGNKWRGGLPLRHRSTIFPSEVQALAKQHADILVTHEAPDSYQFGNAALTRLAESMRVRAAFHGHHHQDLIYEGSVWRGVTLRGVVALDTNTFTINIVI